jgi:hypothetical protein
MATKSNDQYYLKHYIETLGQQTKPTATALIRFFHVIACLITGLATANGQNENTGKTDSGDNAGTFYKLSKDENTLEIDKAYVLALASNKPMEISNAWQITFYNKAAQRFYYNHLYATNDPAAALRILPRGSLTQNYLLPKSRDTLVFIRDEANNNLRFAGEKLYHNIFTRTGIPHQDINDDPIPGSRKAQQWIFGYPKDLLFKVEKINFSTTITDKQHLTRFHLNPIAPNRMIEIVYTTNSISNELIQDFWKAYLNWQQDNSSCSKCVNSNCLVNYQTIQNSANHLFRSIGKNKINHEALVQKEIIHLEEDFNKQLKNITSINNTYKSFKSKINTNDSSQANTDTLISLNNLKCKIRELKRLKTLRFESLIAENCNFNLCDSQESFNDSLINLFFTDSSNQYISTTSFMEEIKSFKQRDKEINESLAEFKAQLNILKANKDKNNEFLWLEAIFKNNKNCLNKYILCCPETISCATVKPITTSTDSVWRSNNTISRDTVFNRNNNKLIQHITITENRTPRTLIAQNPASPKVVPDDNCKCQTKNICNYSTIVQPGSHTELIRSIIQTHRDPFNQVYSISNSSYEFNFNTRNASRIIFDFGGVFANNRADGYNAFVPYAGIMLDFRRYNRTVPYKLIQKSGGITDRLSLGIGVNLQSLAGDGRSDLFLDRISPLTHMGFRLGHAGKIIAGTMWYNKSNITPGVPPRITAAPYVGLSLDFTLAKFIKQLGQNVAELKSGINSNKKTGS